MAPRCEMFRGLLKEVEEDVNKFLFADPEIRVLHRVQSESEGTACSMRNFWRGC